MFNLKFESFLKNEKLSFYNEYETKVKEKHHVLISKVQEKNPKHMVGWYNKPNQDFSKQIAMMKKIINLWKKLKVTDVVLIGIGGSYTSINALISMVMPNEEKQKVRLHYFNSVSPTNAKVILEKITNKSFAIICISKSGTTLETAVGFRIFREELYKRYQNKHAERIVAITDSAKGTLHEIAQKYHYFQFPIQSDIGGRYSALDVGLFPALLVGVDIEAVIKGAQDASKDFSNPSIKKNLAYSYAALRNYLYEKLHKKIEVTIAYDQRLKGMFEQHRQIFAESEGKNNKGLFPSPSIFTTDLHSIGQLYQQGDKIFFETTFLISESDKKIPIKKSSFHNDDNLDYLVKKDLDKINLVAANATIEAHSIEGNVPNIVFEITKADAYHFGYLNQFFCIACAMSAMLLEVNPFDQPGVEAYKKIMHTNLKKE